MKKVLSVITALIIVIFNVNVSSATELSQGEKNELYTEKGQIIFDETSYNLNSKNEFSDFSLSNKKTVKNSINVDSTITKQIQIFKNNCKEEKRTLVAVGWTTVYFREDSNDKQKLVPMTTQDVNKSMTSGTETTKNSLTLYTCVGYDNYNPSQLYAYSKAIWDNGPFYFINVWNYNKKNAESDYNDFMSITWPSNYTITSSSVSGKCHDQCKTDEGYSTVVYEFKEVSSTGDEGLIQLFSMANKGQSSSGTRKWTSKYVHTYGRVTPSLSISAGGVSIGLSGSDDAWQIASSVIF